MILRQIVHEDLGCASYLVGDAEAGVAAVVDPQFDIAPYLELAASLGVRIEHVLETHNHADHVSGHAALVAATGAAIHVHRDASPDYAHEPFDDGDELALGRVVIRAVHAPGHRPEHTVFVLIDTARGPEPWAVLTGDTLFVNDVARPDLAIEKSAGARGLYRTIHERLLTLPDDCEVWPGHLGGSLCGGPAMDPKLCSTIGYERRHNPLLTASEDEFVERMTTGLPPQPPNFQAVVAANRGALEGPAPTPVPLSPREVAARTEEGWLAVDARDDAAYDAAHVPGAVCVPANRPGFGTRLGWIAGPDQPLVITGWPGYGETGGDGMAGARRIAVLARAVGLGRTVAYLDGGMAAWRRDGRPVDGVERIDPAGLRDRLDAEPSLQVLDVRDRATFDAAHIPGSVHADFHTLGRQGVPDGIDPAAPVAVVCATGRRSGIAASLLRRAGVAGVVHVAGGGVDTFKRQGWPLAQAEVPAVAGATGNDGAG